MKHLLCVFIYSVVLTCVLPSESIASGFDQENWVQLDVTGRHVLDVQMLDFNTIIVVGGNESNDAITAVLRSDDRGENWTVIFDTPTSPWLQSVHFPSITRGFAAGYDGMVIRTDDGGQSWDTLQLPGNAALRNYNDVYFTSETVGFLVGGNQTNDSIRTILKTVDGGDSWQIIEDGLGPWLKAVQFVSATVGFASGELGTILKTTNGGNTWTEISLSGNLAARHYNDIRFADEMNGFAVGGQEKNDSIRTILRTSDGGISWQPMLDDVASWLNAIEISPSGILIAVGNDSTILSSNNNGSTWTKVMVPTSINRAVHLNAVDFIYGTLGIVVGNEGQVLLYEGDVPSLPVVTVNAPIIFSSDSVFISGTANANGATTDVFLDYGPTQSFGSTISVVPTTVSGTLNTDVEVLMTDIPNGIYYYRLRAENVVGSSLSVTRQFYIGNLYENVNLDFEQWNEITFDLLEDWATTGDAYQSLSYDGSIAATIASSAFGAIMLGDVDDHPFPIEDGPPSVLGGFPVSSTPDSVVGYFNYEITPGSEGVVFLGLKKNGALLAFEVYTITGSSGGVFERLSFPVAYSDPETPDTVVLGIANNPFFVDLQEGPYNVVSLDNISIISSVPTVVPNSDFEHWQTVEAFHPTNWYSGDLKDGPPINNTIFRTQDAQHGNYAVILRNQLQHNDPAWLVTGDQDYNKMAKFPVAGRHATFNGYYKYDMASIYDTVQVRVHFFESGIQVGSGDTVFSASVSSYTPFKIQLGYYPVSPIPEPDSASIVFQIGNDTIMGASVLYLDNLSFDGFVTPYVPPLITSVAEPSSVREFPILVYPNPSNGNVVVEWAGHGLIGQLEVYDMSGNLIRQFYAATDRIQFDMSDQPAGIYFLRVFSNSTGKWQTKKLIRN